MRRNILFSTTRQWNPGDEFILFGVQRLLASIGLEGNPVIFNRNPEVNPQLTDWNPLRRIRQSVKGEQYWKSFFRIGSADNSFKPGMDGSFVDLAVFAGTPAWCSRETLPFYRAIHDYNIPACYLGVGVWPGYDDSSRYAIPRQMASILDKALLITTRDDSAQKLLAPYSPRQLPCPALLAAPHEKEIREVNSVGLIYSTWKTHKSQKIPREAHDHMVSFYKDLIHEYGNRLRFSIIAHYVDELPPIREIFGKNVDVQYSYDARDYLRIYEQFDLVVGARVHGIGLAASLGIPGIHLGHDSRKGTVEGFRAENIDVSRLRDLSFMKSRFEGFIGNAAHANLALREHKLDTFQKYRSLLLGGLKDFLCS